MAVGVLGAAVFLMQASTEGFEVKNLRISPAEVKINESVTITADVKNLGGDAGAYGVTLSGLF
ncbi:unnamed protein product, partial [marine sediment metagenome]